MNVALALRPRAAPPVFGPLASTDCLVERIERIWNLKPRVVVTMCWPHPYDETIVETRQLQMSRPDAAQVLRAARAEGRRIERSTVGYEIACESGASL